MDGVKVYRPTQTQVFSLEGASPNRRVENLTLDGLTIQHTDFMDWKAFVADKLRDDLAAKADATGARGVLPISSHSDAPAVLLSPLSGYGNPDDWLMSRVVDFYGTSIYPRHASSAGCRELP